MIVCDHAGRRVPSQLGDLGLADEAFDRHIAWDIGAAGGGAVAGRAARAPWCCRRYSRLVIDCNRSAEAVDLIPGKSDSTTIPGNQGLSPADRRARLDEIHRPYHLKIAEMLDAAATPPLLVSIHSFTPRLNGEDRPWQFGVLHKNDSKASKAVLHGLRALASRPIGDNQPYAMDEIDFTVPFHAGSRGLDYVEIEMRQDLIETAPGQESAAAMLASVLASAQG